MPSPTLKWQFRLSQNCQRVKPSITDQQKTSHGFEPWEVLGWFIGSFNTGLNQDLQDLTINRI